MKLKDKHVAIFAEKLYEDLELWYPYYRLQEAGAKVTLIGSGSSDTYISKHDYPVTVDTSIDKVNPQDFDAVIIPGGFSPDYMRRYPKMVSFVKTMHQQGKVVAAICHGVWLLASAEILKGKTATCYISIRDDIRHAGAKVVDQEVVQDGNIITSRKPDDLHAFCRTIISALEKTNR